MRNSIKHCVALVDPGLRKWAVPLVGAALLTVVLEFCGGVAVFHLICLLAGRKAIADARFPAWLSGVEGDLSFLVVSILAIFAVKNITRLGDMYFRGIFVERVITDNSQRLLHAYLRAPFEWHSSRHSSQMVRSLVKDADEISREALLALLAAISELAVVVSLGVMLFVTAPRVTLITALVMIVLAGVVVACGKRAEMGWGASYLKISDRIFKQLQETLSSVAEIRLAQAESYVEQQFVDSRRAFGNLVRHRTIIQTWPAVALEMLLIGGLLLSICWVVNTRNTEMVFPVIGILAYTGLRMLPSLGRLLAYSATLRSSRDVISQMLEQVADPGLQPGALGNDESNAQRMLLERDIVFEDVSYTYERRNETGLHELNLRIKCGETVAVTGESGAGKTTLLLLLLGLLKPQRGRILVDGVDIHSNIRGWQQLIGYVPQQCSLFATTIERNIAFAEDIADVDHDRLDEAIQQAQLAEWLETLPSGAQTEVGESGDQVSGGQRQRIAIARALYRNPRVMVLDEPTSGLDVETETAVQTGLLSARRQMIQVIVTHRSETAAACDQEIQLGARSGIGR